MLGDANREDVARPEPHDGSVNGRTRLVVLGTGLVAQALVTLVWSYGRASSSETLLLVALGALAWVGPGASSPLRWFRLGTALWCVLLGLATLWFVPFTWVAVGGRVRGAWYFPACAG